MKRSYSKFFFFAVFILTIFVSHLTITNADETPYISTTTTTPLFSSTSGKTVLATFDKNQWLKLEKEHQSYFQVQFGQTSGFIKKTDAINTSVEDPSIFHGNIPNQGSISIRRNTDLKDEATPKNDKRGQLNKGTIVHYIEKTDTYYKISIGQRHFLINSIDAAEPFIKDTIYFSTDTSDLPIYLKKQGKLVKFGVAHKVQGFQRSGEEGNYHIIQIGNQNAYIAKKGTYREDKRPFENQSNKLKHAGVIQLKKDSIVYTIKNGKQIPLITLFKGQTTPFVKADASAYTIELAGRTGFISKANAIDLYSPIRVTFVGDVMMDWSIKKSIQKHGADYPFKYVSPELKKSHFAVANLETAITTRNAIYPKSYNFKSDPIAIKGLLNANFGLVSLANNHTLDYQKEGLLDTMSHLKKSGMPYIGAGTNSTEAFHSYTKEVNGKKLRFVAFSRVLPDGSWRAGTKSSGIADGYDLRKIQATIRKEKPGADFLFVYIHWGKEKSNRPESFQRDWARKMIDSGADAIIGSHPHVLQGFEYYKGKPIAYSLGNFLFPDYVKGATAQTGLLHLDIKNKTITMNFSPYLIHKDQIKTQPTTTKKQVWKHLQSISYGVKVDNGQITIK
ncbi:CapA family protein [Peribacillus alkalitolerans]|uniref:CapA family protein n=1 Tax=Peribacillus alkalitolerans TaxID=1550385 RepID=UPI0013D0C6C3|nr:CapA family protein [Peribacillus alkalitolerans]